MLEYSSPADINPSSFPDEVSLPSFCVYTGKVWNTKVNVHWKEAEAGSYAWFDSYGILTGSKRQEFFDTNFGLMAATILADADLEHLRPSMDYMLWLFAFDDWCDVECSQDVDEAGQVLRSIMDTLRSPDAARPELKVVAALHDFFNRMRANSSPRTIHRFVEAADFFTQAVLQQTVNRSTDYVPTIEEYIKVRQDTSSTKMFYSVLEYSLDLDLPDEVHDNPILTELKVEYARGDTHNLVFVVMWNERLDLEGAIGYVDQLTRKRLQEYVDAKAQLPSFGPELDPQVALYVQGLEYSFQGFNEWQFLTPRYFGADADKVNETGIMDITALKKRRTHL
ncbi:hypothetical protein FRC09_013211 [Ceratobasidium sp. 395]|nr:hypothetical protein FRC09_013211 [Ceratobasidium sp. 395]